MENEITAEGDDVKEYLVALPTGTLEAPAAYPHGTLLTLELQVRVKGVQIAEDRKGDLVRKHILGLEGVRVKDSLTPAQARALVEAAENAGRLPGQTTIEDHLDGVAE